MTVTQQITFLDTRDLSRTSDFYERVLGLRRVDDLCAHLRREGVEIQRFWEPLV